MRVRFQADVDLNEDIVEATLRLRPQIPFGRAAAGLHGLSDLEVLRRTAVDGAILVTHDQSTMPSHFATFILTSDSPGVLIAPQRYSVASIATDLVLIWEASTPDEWRNVLLHLPL